MELTTTNQHHQRARLGYLTCTGRGVTLVVTARCSCGWSGPSRPWGPDAIADEHHDLDAHLAASGHRQLEACDPAATFLHLLCGHVHAFNDDCAVPYDSPAGQLIRATRSTLSRPRAAADRLAAATALAAWVAGQQDEAVVGAHLAGLDHDQIANATGLRIDEVTGRWGQLLDHLDRLLDRPAS